MSQSHFPSRKLFWCLLLALPVLGLLASGCSAGSMPEATIQITDAGLTAPAEIEDGFVRINFEVGKDHTPIMARLNEGVTMEQFMETFGENPDSAVSLVTLLGGGGLVADTIQEVVYDLLPGTHVVIDFAGEQPPVASFQVAAEDDREANPPEADIQVDLVDFNFAMPAEISAGPQIWEIENNGQQWHEMVIVKLNPGMTIEDLMAMMAAEAEGGEGSGEGSGEPPPFEDVAFWAPMSPGERAWTTLDLEPGNYTILCFLPDFATGMSHVEHGMVRTLTVTES